MSFRTLVLVVWSAAFLVELHCASQRTTTGFTFPTSGYINSSGDASDKNSSRNKRRTLAVDFAVPSLLRYYMAMFIQRPLNGDCVTFNGCYTVRAFLKMQCIPLQKTISSLLDTKLAAIDSVDKEKGNGSSTGQLPYRQKRPVPKVVNLGLTKASRKSNQVVVEIGEDVVKTGCGGLVVYEDYPAYFMEMDLTRILDWWLGAEGGRLRVRLIPERKAQVPGKEDKYSAAIRAADPRLFFQIASSGEPQTRSKSHGGVPRGYWNFSWTAEDEFGFPEDVAPVPERRCLNNKMSCDHLTREHPEFTWSLSAASDLWAHEHPGSEKKGGRSEGWHEGQFLMVNSSMVGGPWVQSPWFNGGHSSCDIDMTVFLHPRQKGRYTVWLVERDKPPVVLLNTDPPHVTGWAVVHLSLGSRSSNGPFRISSSYSQPGEQEAATFNPHFSTNCTMDSSLSMHITLQGRYRCQGGPEITLEQLCDFRVDCPRGDDEGSSCRQFLNGSYCSFEDGLCGWQTIAGKGPSWRSQSSLPKGLRPSCPSSGAVLMVDNSHPKGQRGTALLRSPFFSPPLRNAMCSLRFWMCGGIQNAVLNLSLLENSTVPEGWKTKWQSSSEPKVQHGSWQLVTVPLYGLADWFWLQFSTSGTATTFAVDNLSLSMDCFLSSNGEFTPVVTSTPTMTVSQPSDETTMPAFPEDGMIFPEDSATKWTFHTCGAIGPEGPTQNQCNIAYRNSNVNVTVGTRTPFQGIQSWIVPETGEYRITVYGASGGLSVMDVVRSHGIYIVGDFHLKKDEVLYILVGQRGEDACSNVNTALSRFCSEQIGPMVNKSMIKGGGGGGGGATYVFKIANGTHKPLLIAAGGGGKGYNSHSGDQKEITDMDPKVLGRNGLSAAAGGGGGWTDGPPSSQGGRPLVLGGQGGHPCHKMGWKTHGGFGGGGGACTTGGGGGGYRGGNTSKENDPKVAGQDGTSYTSPEGKPYLGAMKVADGDGEVIIIPVLNCSHCESGECHGTEEGIQCYCEEGQLLAPKGLLMACLNISASPSQASQPPLSHLALGLSVGTSALIAALLLVVSGVMIMYRRKHTELQSIQLELQSPDCKLSKLRASTIMTDYNPNYCFAGKTISVNDLKEVPRRNISLTRGLGHGAFGEVYEGLAVGIPGEPSPMQVAVKTLPEVCSEQDELDFLMESLIISKFSHQNIVRCVGVSLQALPRFILLELMGGGDLKSFLRETRPRLDQPSSLTMVDLLNVARDIARGCQYLEENQFIHRDIAARNCLLTCKGPERVAKIGDFGMARDIYRASYYRKGGRAMLPVKWMPPEAFMEGIFTSKTDTW
ncbi:ALK tyrosine kinase receptor [Clupea harengus]|uniref:receptor protein-tyrosine kinase n=1 Tax=Clupea harengus TaxID=7950 RepID=A0A6P8G8E7_CLUHA|nr:ALK tyrosine kinase receptor [Clupea harengus]